jgi:hypothetical protein
VNLICGFVFVFVRVNLCVIRFIWGVVDVELDCKMLCVELGFSFFFLGEHFAKIQLFLWGGGECGGWAQWRPLTDNMKTFDLSLFFC